MKLGRFVILGGLEGRGVGGSREGREASAAVLSKWLWTFSAMDSLKMSILESGGKSDFLMLWVWVGVGVGGDCYLGRFRGEGGGSGREYGGEGGKCCCIIKIAMDSFRICPYWNEV